MSLDSPFADIQLPGDELVAFALGKECEDFELPVGAVRAHSPTKIPGQ